MKSDRILADVLKVAACITALIGIAFFVSSTFVEGQERTETAAWAIGFLPFAGLLYCLGRSTKC
jgi:hypothetical protein